MRADGGKARSLRAGYVRLRGGSGAGSDAASEEGGLVVLGGGEEA